MSDRVTLDRGDYFELVAKMQKADILQGRLDVLSRDLQAARSEADGFFLQLGRTHGFDPKAGWALDESACALVPAASK